MSESGCHSGHTHTMIGVLYARATGYWCAPLLEIRVHTRAVRTNRVATPTARGPHVGGVCWNRAASAPSRPLCKGAQFCVFSAQDGDTKRSDNWHLGVYWRSKLVRANGRVPASSRWAFERFPLSLEFLVLSHIHTQDRTWSTQTEWLASESPWAPFTEMPRFSLRWPLFGGVKPMLIV